jgi:hypothetical protein
MPPDIISCFFKKKKNEKNKKNGLPVQRNNLTVIDLELQQLQHRQIFPNEMPVYTYRDSDLTEVKAITLASFSELKKSTLIVQNCDIDLGTIQVWVHAGIKNIFLNGCSVIALRWRGNLPDVADLVDNQSIANYPYVQFSKCMIKDDTTHHILKGCTFNHFDTDTGYCSFATYFVPTPPPNSLCDADKLFDDCVLGKDGILKVDYEHELPVRAYTPQ